LYRTRRNLRLPSLKFHVAAAWNERSPLAVLRLLRTTAGDRSRAAGIASRVGHSADVDSASRRFSAARSATSSGPGSTRKAPQGVMGYGEDQIAHRQRRIERLRRAAAGVRNWPRLYRMRLSRPSTRPREMPSPAIVHNGSLQSLGRLTRKSRLEALWFH